MQDPSISLPWPGADAASPVKPTGFLWPTPPYAAYPQPTAQVGPEACEILGLNNSRSQGQLLQFNAAERQVLFQVPPSRNALPLRFGQFRALKLQRPISVPPQRAGDAG